MNVALFSCGSRSRLLLPYVLRSGGNVVAICDVDTRQVAQLKLEGRRHGAVGASVEKAEVHEDYRTLLDDEKSVEAVVVCPGQRWHVPMGKPALDKPIEWDSEVLKAKGAPEADRLIHRELRTKWL